MNIPNKTSLWWTIVDQFQLCYFTADFRVQISLSAFKINKVSLEIQIM